MTKSNLNHKLVRVEHIRRVKYCASGTKTYCDALGIKYKTLIKGQYTIGELEELCGTDPFVRKLLDEAIKDG